MGWNREMEFTCNRTRKSGLLRQRAVKVYQIHVTIARYSRRALGSKLEDLAFLA